MSWNGGVKGALAAALVTVLAAQGASGQEGAIPDIAAQDVAIQDERGAAVRAESDGEPSGLADRVRLEALAPSAIHRSATERRRGLRFSWSDVAHTVGGAVIGGWVGYVGAQVVQSDWDKDENGAFRSQRALWAAAGALLGMAGSQVVGGTTSPVFLADPLDQFDRERRTIDAVEIREARASTAFQLVQLLRPEWLVTRGTHSLSESPRGRGEGDQLVVRPGQPQILVYLNDIRLGDVDRMRDVLAETLTSARFLSAREATLRYGTNHTHGAILLSTAVPAP